MTRDDFNKYVGGKIREYRLKRKFKQYELAEFIKATPSTIDNYERGECTVPSYRLVLIAEVLELRLSTLLPPSNSTSKNIRKENKYKDKLSAEEYFDNKIQHENLNKEEIIELMKGYSSYKFLSEHSTNKEAIKRMKKHIGILINSKDLLEIVKIKNLYSNSEKLT